MAVDDLEGVEEGHGGAEAGADLFDRGGRARPCGTWRSSWRPVSFSLMNFLAKLPSWMLVRSCFMAFLVSAVTMAGLGFVAAPFGGVGDGVVHVLDAAAVEEVDDELEFVEDFEVGELGLVAGFGEDFEAALDEG